MISSSTKQSLRWTHYQNVLLGLSLLLSGLIQASEFSVKSVTKAAPSELGDSIKGELGEEAIQISKGDKPLYEFWLASSVTLNSAIDAPNRALSAIKQTTLLGAVKVIDSERDYRDDELFDGTYTIRFGLRPDDGNHLGTSNYRYFAVLIAAKNDQELGKITRSRQLVKASSKTNPNDHPLILSLFPVNSSDKAELSVQEPAPEHTALRLSLAAKTAEGADAGFIVFDFVIDGMADF